MSENKRTPIEYFSSFHYEWIDRALAIFTAGEAARGFLDVFPEFCEVEGMTLSAIKKAITYRFSNAKHDPSRASYSRIAEKRKEMVSWLQQNEDVFCVWNPILALKDLEKMRQSPDLTVNERIKVIQTAMQIHDKLLGSPVIGKSVAEGEVSPWQDKKTGSKLRTFTGASDSEEGKDGK